MVRIKKKNVPKHLLVVDTNELWQETKNKNISEKFEMFWNEHSEKYTLELHIPEIVRGEILFQHTNSALKALNRANHQFENMSRSANKNYKHIVTPAKIRKDVEVKIDRWILSKSAVLEPTPTTKIDWKDIINKAVWRKPPFEEDPNKEKGFRDAMILETLREITLNEKSFNIAFVSRDKLLRETAEKELKNNKTLSFFESLEQLSSYLKLMDEKLTNEFIVAIQKRAREKFFDRKTKSGIMMSERIRTVIRTEFGEHFVFPPHLPHRGLLSSSTVNMPTSEWEHLSEETVWIQSPDFVKIENERTYHWSSVVNFVQLFKYRTVGHSTLLAPQNGDVHIRILPFTANWKADVKSDGRFHNIEFLNVEMNEKRFEEPSTDDIELYRLGNHFEES